MAANLTPQYREAEERYKKAVDPEERLVALREMLALLPKHKGTEKMQAELKRKLAQLEDDAQKPKKHGHHADPGHVKKEGAGQWVILGPPNAGKSSLLKALTNAHPEVAPYPFTTRAPLPGMMFFEDAPVQLVDTPAVSAAHTESWMPNLVRSADGLLLVFDVTADDNDEGMRAIDALLDKARVWPDPRPIPDGASPALIHKPAVVAANRSDEDGDGTFGAILREIVGPRFPFHAVSAEHGLGLEDLKRPLWEKLGRMRIYAKEPGKKADLAKPFTLPTGGTVEDLAREIHKEIAAGLKFARIWGSGAFDGQQVDRHHVLKDKDVVEIHA